MSKLILASSSQTRAQLFRDAGVEIDTHPPRVDEEAIKSALLAEDTTPRNLADALAEAKAAKVSAKHHGALVFGCDQVLAFEGSVLSKPATHSDAMAQLRTLRGKTHRLWSAAVCYEDGKPIWRHISQADLTMRAASDRYLEGYVARNFDSIKHSVGSYKLEEEGVRLFTQVRGDYFTILGLPLLDILSWLTLRGTLEQ